MQDPNTMTFSARASAKDEQIRSIASREANEARLKKDLADEEAARAKDEEYLVQLALADAGANQRILEKYAQYLPPPAPPASPPPPPPPAPEAQPETGAASTEAGEASTGTETAATAAADPAAPGVDSPAGEVIPVT